MALLDYINEKTNNAYKDFKLVSVVFDRSELSCTFKFLYKDTFDVSKKEELGSLVSQYINTPDVKVIIKCKKAYVDSDLVKDVLYNFIMKNFSSLGVDFSADRIFAKVENGVINVVIFCTQFQFTYIKNASVEREICDYAGALFFEEFSLELKILESEPTVESLDTPQNLILDEPDEPVSRLKHFKVAQVHNLIGEVSGNPIEISSINRNVEDIEIAGTIKYFTEKTFESKRKDKDGNSTTKTYYSFAVVDKTGRMNCVYFPTKADTIKAQNLKDDMVVLLHGSAEEFGGRLDFKVRSIGLCEILDTVEEETVADIKPVPENYTFVTPEPYVQIFQDNLFAQSQEISDYLMQNDVVVFDIETTGLEATRCEILEIGAVKIHHGKITETFETLIKPKGSIPDEITALTGITESMVAHSPSIAQVLPDFYKFCYGTVIMAYNIDFDYKFVSIAGKKLGYIFDMKQVDVLYLARAFVPGLKNFKLGTVVKKLGVSLENAHRAVHDAMATAEVVIKLNKFLA